MGSLRHRIRDDAVDADACEHQRDAGEAHQQQHGEAAQRDRIGEQLFHRDDVVNRLIFIHLVYLAAHGSDQILRIRRRMNYQRRELCGKLRFGKVNLHRVFSVEPVLLDIADDADDGAPGLRILLRAGELDALAKRLLIRPQLSGHSLVDERD